MSQHLVVLLLGSNLGNIQNNIDDALAFIEAEIGDIFKKSEYLLSAPVEYESSNIFCNIAVKITTSLSPTKLLHQLKKIERKMGRNEDSVILGRYSDRIIDIDIVMYDNLCFSSENLKLPHIKHINERDFSKKIISQLDNNKLPI